MARPPRDQGDGLIPPDGPDDWHLQEPPPTEPYGVDVDAGAWPKWAPDDYVPPEPPADVPLDGAWPPPEDRGDATPSEEAESWYVDDLVRPGRIVVVAAEEGTGKSYAITGELAIRVATAGGSFADSWPVCRTGPVLVLSEMHPDDDYEREAAILAALELDRSALAGCYFRLPLATAAGDRPALQVPEWREWIAGWLRERGAVLVVFDTATGAAQVDPWGRDLQAIFRGLRGMIETHPALAIVAVVHLRKPAGRGGRSIADVLGEWGRWCDVVLLMERDGPGRVKLSSRKRVRRERIVVATKRDGLLVEPQDVTEGSKSKIPVEKIVAAIGAEPGVTARGLGDALGVSRHTALRYAAAVEAMGRIRREQDGPRGAYRYFPDEAAEQLVMAAETGEIDR